MSANTPSEQALKLVRHLQAYFVKGLEKCATDVGFPLEFTLAEWLRDGGLRGGGSRYFTADNEVFNRASVNVSHIHYADDPDKKLASATALSTIIHPQNAHAPSMHMHISWTEMKGEGGGYWRIMADLNPAIEKPEDTAAFLKCFQTIASEQFDEAVAQGEKYFYIPALDRHRGVAHFYLEQYRSEDTAADLQLAGDFGTAVINCYLNLLGKRLGSEMNDSDRAAQLAYHSLYLFQVLTLDRGTTSGLLVHDQNDLGIMGSLPSVVDKELLRNWQKKVPPPQGELVVLLAEALDDSGVVDAASRLKLAQIVREHYQKNPSALAMQASGNTIPPTVENHHSQI